MRIFLTFICLNFCVAHAALVSLSPTQDTYTTSRGDDSPFWTQAYFRTKNDTGTNPRLGFVEFDSTAVGTASTATLNLTPENSGLGDSSTGTAEFEVFGIDSDVTTWSESTLTYTNDDSLIAAGTSLGTFNLTNTGAGSPVNFSSAALLSFLNANPGKVTFLIQRNSFTGGSYVHQFKSSNAASGSPTLDLIVVPEISSLALLVIGFGLVVVNRRR